MTPRRRLIVNADDFGLTDGVTRGIARAHRDGIVTSTSLMVDAPGATTAARLARELPALDIGLHAEAPAAGEDWPRALARQLERFRELMGRTPTHLDSHHEVHRDAAALPHFARLAGILAIPLRGSSPARCYSRFYGQWAGESHPEHIAPDSLLRMLDAEVGAGWTELACHPGEAGGGLRSSYTVEREIELATLCDPRVRGGLDERGIELTSFTALAAEAA